jgi:hypothetical protein
MAIWLVVPFAQHWSSRDARLDASRARWQRLATLVATSGRLRTTLDAKRQATESDQSRLVDAATPALAASALQAALQSDADESGIQMERIDAAGEPHPDKPGLLAIPVQLQARGDLYGLVGFLTRLERGTPILVVDELNINPGLELGEDGAAGASPTRQAITWTIRLHGLYEGSPEGTS